MSTVHLQELTKRYAGSPDAVVKGVNLEIQSGELVALLGSSGCGKTTTLRMIAGLIDPTSGDIRIGDQSILGIVPERRNVAMVFQKPLLFPHMNVFDNVSFGLRMQGHSDDLKGRVAEILELVRLPGYESRRPGQLSGGQEQRVALARALITRPRVLLLDEPLSALDASLRVEMRELILRIQRELGTTMIFVTHDQEEAVMLANRIALMSEGVVRQFDTPQGFYDHPQDEVVARFFGGVNFIKGIMHGSLVETAIGALRLSTDVSDGDVLLTIRPEGLRFTSEPGTNTARARVKDQMYLGTHKRYWCEANGLELQLTADPSSPYQVGDEVLLHLPAERLWPLGAQVASPSKVYAST